MKVIKIILSIVFLQFIATSGSAIEWKFSGAANMDAFTKNTGTGVRSELQLSHVHTKINAEIMDELAFVLTPCWTHDANVSLIQAEALVQLDDLANFNAGRFVIPFGRFNDITPLLDEKTISRPLIYASHNNDFISVTGYGTPIFMTSFSDVGVLFSGSIWPVEEHQIWYGVYVIKGLWQEGYSGLTHGASAAHAPSLTQSLSGASSTATTTPSATDIEWHQAPQRFDVDNNDNKTLGGRLSYGLGDALTIGGSGMFGRYDNANSLFYAIYGGDLRASVAGVNLTAEYVVSPRDWKALNHEDFEDFEKEKKKAAEVGFVDNRYTITGHYLQLDVPVGKFDFVSRYDYLERRGAVLKGAGQIDPMNLDEVSKIINKYTIGIGYNINANLTLKAEYERFVFVGQDEHDQVNRGRAGIVVRF